MMRLFLFAKYAKVFALFIALSIGFVSVSVFSEVKVLAPSGEQLELESYLEGQAYKNDESEERWLLIKLWSVDCGICRQQVPVISGIQEKAEQSQQTTGEGYSLTVLGISIDAAQRKEEVDQYIAKHKPSYRNWMGEYTSVAKWFKEVALEDFRGTPSYLLFDPQGRLAAVQTSVLKPNSIDNFIHRYARNR